MAIEKLETAGSIKFNFDDYSYAQKEIKNKLKNEKRKLREKFEKKFKLAKEDAIKPIKDYIIGYFVNEVNNSGLNWEILFERDGSTEIILKKDFIDYVKREYIDTASLKELEGNIISFEYPKSKDKRTLKQYYAEVLWAEVVSQTIYIKDWIDYKTEEERKEQFELIGAEYSSDMDINKKWDLWNKHKAIKILEYSKNVDFVIAESEDQVDLWDLIVEPYGKNYSTYIYSIGGFIENKMKEFKIWDWQIDMYMVKEYDRYADWNLASYEDLLDAVDNLLHEDGVIKFVGDEQSETGEQYWKYKDSADEEIVYKDIEKLLTDSLYWSVVPLRYSESPEINENKIIKELKHYKNLFN